ncbi:uncharacterized protein LOC131010908 [Salvia miltiorrhiza]|uniref:uncharacterized protein LOC131010908 n=1 Tax=Salvia miltiorrhiza TaxID=226208 RepID=UPI0025AC8F2A|nr:uncharacterized protein LOC131010908 [Salvia miltiorrhiza]
MIKMRGREGKGPPSTDLLVCFPSRAHLSLMPKPICSPARPSDSSSSSFHRRRPSHHHLRKSTMWARTKHKNNNSNADISEPTSPKVTCAGQIKVKTKPNSCKNWQSVMEEIERMHNHRKQKKRAPWMEALGFKKEVMQFLTCLRKISLDFRCFGSIPAVEISSDDDEGEEEEEDEDDGGASGAVFSKWFMILQEDNNLRKDESVIVDDEAPPPPPPNALLLMRCRSAPAKSWLEEREEEEERERRNELEINKEEEETKGSTDFCEFAVEIAKENWINQEKICRSRSWKR